MTSHQEHPVGSAGDMPAEHGGEDHGQPIPEVSARSDAHGVVRFPFGRAGKWYVKFIHMAAVSADSVDYESQWATLTFEVR